jgi:hypothetical protein
MLISFMDGSLVWSNRYHQSGTQMPLGAVHPIIASEAKQSSLLRRNEKESWIASAFALSPHGEEAHLRRLEP